MKVSIKQLGCKRCGHQWVPRKSIVWICPKCKSYLWDIKRKEKKDGIPTDSMS